MHYAMGTQDPGDLRKFRHDARNLLASARLALQGTMRAETLSERGRKRLAICETSLDRLEALLSELGDAEGAQEMTDPTSTPS